jgi:hypothetical protein
MKELWFLDKALEYVWTRPGVLILVTICYWFMFWCAVSLVLNGHVTIAPKMLLVVAVIVAVVQGCIGIYFLSTKAQRNSLEKDEVFMRRLLTLQYVPLAFSTYGFPVLVVLVFLNGWTGLIKWIALGP